MTEHENMPPGGYDVIVVGAGGAGPAAAAAALEGGARRVAILEARNKAGGNAVFATGFYACESPVQRAGLVDVPRDQVFKRAMDFHHGAMVNPRVLRAYIDKSGDTIRWLMDKGMEFTIGSDFKMAFNQEPTWHLPKKETKSGHDYVRCGEVVKVLLEEVRSKGSDLLLDTEVLNLLTNEHGAVRGVLVRGGDGVPSELEAPAVILATGGFHGNEEMLRRYFWFHGPSLDGFRVKMDGSGITMAQQAGAALEPYATLIKETSFSSDHPKEGGLGISTREPDTIWVNRLGRRFTDETCAIHLQTGANPLVMQPGAIGFALYDDAKVQDVVDNGWLVPRLPPMGTDKVLREQLARASVKGEWCKVCDNLDEIAAWIGAEPSVLRAEIEEYNAGCARGHDAVFAKDRRYLRPLSKPPYHAVRFRPMIIDTAGPVRVDETMRVLGSDYTPVPGLYAAGALAAGWQGQDYCGQHLFGSALGFALNSGRIAGESAAAQVSAE